MNPNLAKFLTFLLFLAIFAAAFVWLPGFLRPGARQIREDGLSRHAASAASVRDYPLPAPDRAVGPGWKIKIKKGDKLWTILRSAFPNATAEQLADAVTETARANRLRNPSALKIGQYIRIPEFPSLGGNPRLARH